MVIPKETITTVNAAFEELRKALNTRIEAVEA
jgi:hypothetical protein